jgi:hypothetical protein
MGFADTADFPLIRLADKLESIWWSNQCAWRAEAYRRMISPTAQGIRLCRTNNFAVNSLG